MAEGIVAFKEGRRRRLAIPFGAALAEAAAGLVEAGELLHPAERPWLIVPAPSTAEAVCERGFHHMREVGEEMARYLQQASTNWVLGGVAGEIAVAELLCAAPHHDAVGLTAEQRRANLAGAITCDPDIATQLALFTPSATPPVTAPVTAPVTPQGTPAVTASVTPLAAESVRRRAHRLPHNVFSHWEILVVDDVTTTGATLAECFFALHHMGMRPRGALTLASA
ncbi:hypothetical protein [Lawsonella sp.]|uniref:ComF family protein n=1 Tax=Lawsonella sp. TaxID=2041415 RepID=UPI002A748DC3|nr:hypothetical protein [Lawsonella sp.]